MIGPGERGNTLTVSCFDPSMDIERARKIVKAMLENAFYNMGLRDGEDKPTDIAAYTLAEMIQANQMVSDDPGETDPETGGTKRMMHCDDRLVAALYACCHFPAQDENEEVEPLARIGNKVLLCVRAPAPKTEES
jgi:hypothetical protein